MFYAWLCYISYVPANPLGRSRSPLIRIFIRALEILQPLRRRKSGSLQTTKRGFAKALTAGPIKQLAWWLAVRVLPASCPGEAALSLCKAMWGCPTIGRAASDELATQNSARKTPS